MTSRLTDWLPAGRTITMRPAGTWWDAVRAPRHLGLTALGVLGSTSGAVIEDPGSGSLLWLVEPGRSVNLRSLPEAAAVEVYSETMHVPVPGPQRTAGPLWRIPPTTRRWATSAAALEQALRYAVARELGPRGSLP
ncbi:hypothetical protein [Streptomyces sp. NPDC053541]|uniref:hypothetical protein n=1 Tax=Streptomyces sp. NPDC053541 TaxID=3365709 RepID=UPI0037D33D52